MPTLLHSSLFKRRGALAVLFWMKGMQLLIIHSACQQQIISYNVLLRSSVRLQRVHVRILATFNNPTRD